MKRMIERWMALICALCLFCIPACAASEGEEEESGELRFSDVTESDWFYAPVTWLAERGILRGFEDGTFRPQDTLTEMQLIKLLLKPWMPEEVEEPQGNQWWAPYAEFGLREGILTVEDLASMDSEASRLRVAQLLARLPLLPVSEDYLVEPDLEWILPAIADREEIPEEDLASVITVYASGIMQGYDDGCFHPERTLTRAEGAAVVLRLLLPEERSPRLRYSVPEEWFAGALLLGNSHCGGLSMYGEIPLCDVCFSYGGSVFSGLSTTCRDRYENTASMRTYLQKKQYEDIILVYGTNEMGYDLDYLRPRFETFLDRVGEVQPEARLWLCTAPPVNPALAGTEVFTVANCQAVNGLLRELAEERGLGLIDVYDYFADEEGILPREYTGDGIHLTIEGYRRWAQFLASAVVPAEEAPSPEEDASLEEESPADEEPPAEEEPPAGEEPSAEVEPPADEEPSIDEGPTAEEEAPPEVETPAEEEPPAPEGEKAAETP